MFERNILIFWSLMYCGLWLLRRNPQHIIARAAFTWMGPSPKRGEAWAYFQLRWASYSFGWLCQIALLLSGLIVFAEYDKTAFDKTWFKVFLFALPLGAGMATLASLGFLIKSAKAQLIGPNPTWNMPNPTPDHIET